VSVISVSNTIKTMTKVSSIEEMEVFKRSHSLTLQIYKMTDLFPQSEKFGLTSQMRRASSSIATNLMEGSHRLSTKEFRQFAGISKGSAGEMKYHLLLARDLGYLSENDYCILSGELEEISKMLNGLIRSLSYSDTDTKH
jgi:four helix bundle protein